MDATRVQQILGGFSKHKVLVIGDAVIDHYVSGKVERLNPEAPVPILHAYEEKYVSGGAGNSAKNLAALGAKTILVSVVGEDNYANLLQESAEKEGFEAHFIKDASRPTIRKVRHIVNNQQLLRVDYEKSHDVASETETQLIKQIEKVGMEVNAIFVSDYAKGTITKNIAEAIMNIATSRNIPVVADVKVSRAPYFVGATFISPNIKEGHEFLGLNYLEQRLQPAEIAQKLNTKMKANVLLTLGGDGMYLYTNDGMSTHVAQEHKSEVFDVSGAGDTVTAVILLALLSGATYEEAAQFGNAGGAVVVSRIGTATVSVEELRQTILHKHA